MIIDVTIWHLILLLIGAIWVGYYSFRFIESYLFAMGYTSFLIWYYLNKGIAWKKIYLLIKAIGYSFVKMFLERLWGNVNIDSARMGGYEWKHYFKYRKINQEVKKSC